jgi:hypothetical protein
MIYAILKNQEKALLNIDEAKYLFNEIYSTKDQQSEHEELIHG